MDTRNYFFTRATALHARAEYGAGLVACLAFIFYHWSSVNVWLGLLLFAYIDLVGTVPSLVAAHRSPTGRISRSYYVVYDVTHSMITQGAFIAVFCALFGWQWSLLAIPVHLFLDRSVFNNYPKPFGVSFDPVEHPAFAEFRRNYEQFRPETADWKAIKAGAASTAEPARVTPVG
jgi:hypothetical protein